MIDQLKCSESLICTFDFTLKCVNSSDENEHTGLSVLSTELQIGNKLDCNQHNAELLLQKKQNNYVKTEEL